MLLLVKFKIAKSKEFCSTVTLLLPSNLSIAISFLDGVQRLILRSGKTELRHYIGRCQAKLTDQPQAKSRSKTSRLSRSLS